MATLSEIINGFIAEHEIDTPNFDVELMNLVNKVFEAFIKINLGTKIPENEPKTKTQKVLKADKIEDPAVAETREQLNNCTTGVLNEFCKTNNLKVGGNKTQIMDRVWRFMQGETSDDDMSSRNKPKKEKKKTEAHKCSGCNAKGAPCAVAGNEQFGEYYFCWRHIIDAEKFIENKKSDTEFLKAAAGPAGPVEEITPAPEKKQKPPSKKKAKAPPPPVELETDEE
jgi:hypothetical protein